MAELSEKPLDVPEVDAGAYAKPTRQWDARIMYSIYFFTAVLLILICGNVGLLLFARAASREADLVLRTALGASRGRIVAQMFAEVRQKRN